MRIADECRGVAGGIWTNDLTFPPPLMKISRRQTILQQSTASRLAIDGWCDREQISARGREDKQDGNLLGHNASLIPI